MSLARVEVRSRVAVGHGPTATGTPPAPGPREPPEVPRRNAPRGPLLQLAFQARLSGKLLRVDPEPTLLMTKIWSCSCRVLAQLLPEPILLWQAGAARCRATVVTSARCCRHSPQCVGASTVGNPGRRIPQPRRRGTGRVHFGRGKQLCPLVSTCSFSGPAKRMTAARLIKRGVDR